MTRHLTALAALMIVAAASGCAEKPLTGPPEIRLGREECAECGMLISEERCSSALLVERGGRREHEMYDDIGCMLDSELERGPERRILERYVHDYESKQWIAADAAVFLLGDPDALATPMGSGIIAFSGRQIAESVRGSHGGTLLGYAELPGARHQTNQDKETIVSGD